MNQHLTQQQLMILVSKHAPHYSNQRKLAMIIDASNILNETSYLDKKWMTPQIAVKLAIARSKKV